MCPKLRQAWRRSGWRKWEKGEEEEGGQGGGSEEDKGKGQGHGGEGVGLRVVKGLVFEAGLPIVAHAQPVSAPRGNHSCILGFYEGFHNSQDCLRVVQDPKL